MRNDAFDNFLGALTIAGIVFERKGNNIFKKDISLFLKSLYSLKTNSLEVIELPK